MTSEESLLVLTTAITPPRDVRIDIPPPVQPVEFPIPLPNDYLKLLSVYGSGSFCHRGSELVKLVNPYAANGWGHEQMLLETMRFERDIQEDESSGEPFGAYPFSIFPEPGGLLPWAWADTRLVYSWQTTGDPADWPVIVAYEEDVFTRFDMSATQFLAKLCKGLIDTQFMGHVDPLDLSQLAFKSH